MLKTRNSEWHLTKTTPLQILSTNSPTEATDVRKKEQDIGIDSGEFRTDGGNRYSMDCLKQKPNEYLLSA